MISSMFLAGAVIGDAASAYALARSDRLRRPGPAALSIGADLLALVAFSLALDGIPIGVADAVFAAAGSALVTVLGVALLGERLGTRKGPAQK